MTETYPAPQGGALILLTISLALATFMNVLDTSIANVAIPQIAGDVGVSPDQGSWVITSFAVSTAIAVPLTGWLGKRFGEVRLFVICTLLFTVTSWLCGLSNSLSMLIFFRVLQGAVAGPMIPLSQSLLLANYPDDQKGFATSLWAMTVVVAPIFGPILGGWLTDNYSWPWIFYINIPVGFLAAGITWVMIGKRETATVKSPIDMIGLTLLIVWVGCLQILLDKGSDLDWFNSPVIIALGITSLVAFVFFLVWELTEINPVVDLNLYLKRNFTIGSIGLSLGYMFYFGGIVLFPLWLQTQMGYTATIAGLAASPVGILAVFFSPVVGRILGKIDLRSLTSIGFLIFGTVAFWRSSFNTDVTFSQLAWPIFLQGAGVAFFFIPLLSISLSNLPSHRIASASGLANFTRILGGSFGTSLTITFWNRRESLHHSQLTENITQFNPNSVAAVNQLHQLGFQHNAAYDQLQNVVTVQSYMLSTNDFFWLSGFVFFMLIFVVWLAKPPFSLSGSGGGAH